MNIRIKELRSLAVVVSVKKRKNGGHISGYLGFIMGHWIIDLNGFLCTENLHIGTNIKELWSLVVEILAVREKWWPCWWPYWWPYWIFHQPLDAANLKCLQWIPYPWKPTCRHQYQRAVITGFVCDKMTRQNCLW